MFICFDATAFTVLLEPNLSEGADNVSGQLHRDKECPFSGITSWRKVLKRKAWSVVQPNEMLP